MINHSLRQIKSFIRHYRGFTPAQSQAYTNLWRHYGLDPHHQDWQTIFPTPKPLLLDIGFGMGESLLYLAEHEPKYHYVGIEVHQPGILGLMKKLKAAQLDNVKLIDGDALELLKNFIPDHTLAKIQLFFPDPWPKARHHKRRFINKENLDLIADKLVRGGELHIATDWENYAQQIISLTAQCSSLTSILNEGVDIYTLRPLTRFERKGKLAGRKIFDLRFKCQGSDKEELLPASRCSNV